MSACLSHKFNPLTAAVAVGRSVTSNTRGLWFKCIDCELTRNDQRNEKEACFGIIVPPLFPAVKREVK